MSKPVIRQRTDLHGVMGRILDQHGPQMGAAIIMAALVRDKDRLNALIKDHVLGKLPTPPQQAA